jgi:hypothetical protein
MMTAASVVFERHDHSAGLFSPAPSMSPLMNDPFASAPPETMEQSRQSVQPATSEYDAAQRGGVAG